MEKEYYINNIKDISKLIWVILFASLIINGYLVQRCFEWNGNAEDKVLGLEIDPDYPSTLEHIIAGDLTQQQGSQLGLKINYGTLSLMWPLILLGLYYSINVLIQKKLKNFQEINNNYPEITSFSLTLIPSSLLFTKRNQTLIIIIIFLVVMPFVGIMFHGYSGYFMINLIDQAFRNWQDDLQQQLPEGMFENSIIPKLKFIFSIQLVLSIMVLFGVVYVNFKSIKLLNTFANTVYSK